MKDTKPFIVDGETLAEVSHWQTAYGPKFIDIAMVKITNSQAKRLSKWLLDAIEECDEYNSERSK